jgi:hypothetical protein
MRSAARIIVSTLFLLPVSFLPVNAETQVFQDAVFPYRVSCKNDWVQEIKNDSIFQLQTSLIGKKTRFRIKKYLLRDTTGTRELMGWSRVSFAVNREIADELGTVLSSDTGINKKIGTLRAFELCALYLQKSGVSDSVWWGELSRWTEYLGYGYYVGVITDTADLIANRLAYKALLDSVSIGTTTAVSFIRQNSAMPAVASGPFNRGGGMYNLLGRKFRRSAPGTVQFVVQRHQKRFVGFKPGGR